MLLPLLAAGCFTEVKLDLDQDNDGYSDQDEVAAYTDPLDESDNPYELGWHIDSCRWDVEGTGVGEGDVMTDYEMVSQTGEIVRLHDFCGQAVLIEIGFYG